MTVSEGELTPVNDLAERFWEAILELSPATATLYGDDRYNDRLEDPGPEGRARMRALMERTAAEATAIDVDGLPTEDRITRDMLKVIAELHLEEDDERLQELRVVDQMGGPQQLLPQLTQFQPADTPERLDAFIARLEAYPAFMAANVGILRDGLASGLTAPRIVAERTIAQIERMLGVPIDSAIVPSMVKVANEADRERVREVVRDVTYPADEAFLEALRGDYLAATREDPGLWSAPNGEQLYRTAIRSWTTLDLEPEDVHRTGLEELESIEAERRVIARAAGFGDDTAAYRAALDADVSNTPQTKAELIERATEDIERAMAVAPRYFGVLPRAACDVRRGRGIQGEGRTLRLLLPARRRTARDRGSTTRTATTCRAASTPSSPRRPTTRPPRATISRSRSRWRTRTSTPSGASGRGWSAAPTSRAGASTANGWPTRWASSAMERSGSGCSTPRPGGRPGWWSTPASTRCAGRASARSTSSRPPACPRPTPSSRPTATSAGRARR